MVRVSASTAPPSLPYVYGSGDQVNLMLSWRGCEICCSCRPFVVPLFIFQESETPTHVRSRAAGGPAMRNCHHLNPIFWASKHLAAFFVAGHDFLVTPSGNLNTVDYGKVSMSCNSNQHYDIRKALDSTLIDPTKPTFLSVQVGQNEILDLSHDYSHCCLGPHPPLTFGL